MKICNDIELIDDEISEEELLDILSEYTTVYEVLGYAFHSQQQGLMYVRFKDFSLSPIEMEDTDGSVLNGNELVKWGELTLKLKTIIPNQKIS